MMQALVEGIALRTSEVLTAMGAFVPFDVDISVDGGLSRNAYLIRMLAEVGGHGLRLPAETEQTAAGLARLAAEASGMTVQSPPPGRPIMAQTDHRVARLATFAAARQAVESYARREVMIDD